MKFVIFRSSNNTNQLVSWLVLSSSIFLTALPFPFVAMNQSVLQALGKFLPQMPL